MADSPIAILSYEIESFVDFPCNAYAPIPIFEVELHVMYFIDDTQSATLFVPFTRYLIELLPIPIFEPDSTFVSVYDQRAILLLDPVL